MAPLVCSSFLRVLPNYMRVVYQWEVFVAEGLWAGRVAGLVGRQRSLAGGAGLSTIPGWVRLSTCAWPPTPAIAGALHRWAGGYGHATKAHRGVMTTVGAVAAAWPPRAATEAFGGAS